MKSELDLLLESVKSDYIKESTDALRALDTASVEFDNSYYHKRRHSIRRYKKNFLTNAPEKAFGFVLMCFLIPIVLLLTLITPIIPMLLTVFMILRQEEKRYEEGHLTCMLNYACHLE
ncbi:MAG: hypothetical protein IJY39_00595 [Clostridia bacterium]|nr:hypothetical protein [Clostridia bacterium]